MNLALSIGIVLSFVGVIHWLRVVSARACSMPPETASARGVPEDTRLSRILDGWQAPDDKPFHSLCHPLGDAREALRSRIGLTELADATIDAQYYVFHDDESGRGLLAALVDAARRGVHVRLLLDDIDLKGRDALLTRLAGDVDNLDIRIFNPLWLRAARPLDFVLRFPRSSRRMHNKSFTVDSLVCIVGGRNIGDEYFGVDPGLSFTDYDMLAAGEVADQVVTQFDRYWHGGLSIDCAQVAGPAEERRYQDWLQQLKEARSRFQPDADSDEDLPGDRLLNRSLQACHCHAEVLSDPPEKVLSRLFDTGNSLAPTIMDLMLSARKTLLISSPYLIPGDPGLELFRRLRERHVSITVLTNSFAANDVLAVHAGYIDYRQRMVELGIQLYEFKPDNEDRHVKLLGSKRSSLHAKTFIIDSDRLFVGSFNLDPRSAIHNTEMGIVFNSEGLAASLHDTLTDRLSEIAYHLQLSEHGQLKWEERSAQGKVIMHSAEPNTNRWQRLGVYLLTWLPVEWLM